MGTIRTVFRAAAVLFLAGQTTLFADQGGAQAPADGDPPMQKGVIEMGAILGSALPITLFRAHKDRRLTMGAFQVGRVMTGQRGPGPLAGSFELLLEMAPLLVIRQPEQTFGVSVSPLHLRWNFAPIPGRRRVRGFAEASAGLLLTTDAVPARTTRFNFLDQAGFGLRWENHPRRAWLLGYRFQHVSNGGRVRPNKGVNFNFLYIGVTFKK